MLKGDECGSGEQIVVVLEFGGDEDSAGELRLEQLRVQELVQG